ncbi:hypothetical protein C8R47DRAFT_1075642, partial [Mycena vitilis]
MSRDSPSVPNESLNGAALVGTDFYTVYKGRRQFLLHMPTFSQAAPLDNDNLVTANFVTPTYISNRLPYIMFIPASTPWYGPLLDRLNYPSMASLPIEKRPNGEWGLVKAVLEDWWQLEDNLTRVAHALTLNVRQRPEELRPFARPYRVGYMTTRKTEREARRVIFKSIDGFLPVLGQITMFLLLQAEAARVEEGHEDWRSVVCARAKVHAAWFADLENSVAGDFSIPRIGGIFDLRLPHNTDEIAYKSSPLEALVGFIIAENLPMPLYIRWGNIHGTPQIRIPRTLIAMTLVPDGGEQEYLERLPGRVK